MFSQVLTSLILNNQDKQLKKLLRENYETIKRIDIGKIKNNKIYSIMYTSYLEFNISYKR